MLLALFADLHANREAVSACLAHARGSGAERSIFLGDYVGHGADPEWVLDIVLGSVGQPRDGNPAASYALLDTAKNQITWQRVPYDVEAAMAKVRSAGLPEAVAARLQAGR